MRIFTRMMLLALVGVLFSSSGLIAQTQQLVETIEKVSAAEQAKQEVAILKRVLKLDDEQAGKAETICLKYAKKRGAVVKKPDEVVDDVAALRALSKEQTSELKAMLTERQVVWLDGLRKAPELNVDPNAALMPAP